MDRNRFYSALRDYWGYETFRDSQLPVIESVCGGRDTLALMPTGAGKSLLYQIPGICMDGVCIVVTPLVSLMKDQTDRLRSRGVNAAAVHSGLTTRQIDIVLDNCCWGDVKFLYVSPERVSGQTFRTRLRNMPVSLIAVDEAHCISQWGYDFRPSYLRIAELREIVPDAAILALTASATPEVADDILRHLGMKEGRIFRSSFARDNLSFAVRHTDDKAGQLLRVVNNVGGAGIVYVRTRETSQKVAEWLNGEGIPAEYYHAGLPHGERSARQESWMKGRTRVMVATNAFGMGIDKADVRFVVHYDVPDSLEAYYQEAGRAGRDGRRSYAVMLAGSDEKSRSSKRFDTEYPPLEKIKECYETLFNHLQIGIGDGRYASFNFNIHEFAARARMYTGSAFNALKILQQNGYLTLTDETDNPPRIMFTVNRDDLYRVRIEREELDHIIKTLLRLYVGVFHDRLVAIDLQEVAYASGYTADKVMELLKRLWELRIIKYVPGSRSPILFLNEERLPAKDVFISPESYRIRKDMGRKRMESVFAYMDNDLKCRGRVIREYFGETEPEECGSCDVCLSRKKGDEPRREDYSMRDEILSMLREGPLTVKQVVGKFTADPSSVTRAIDELTAGGKIITVGGGKIGLK